MRFYISYLINLYFIYEIGSHSPLTPSTSKTIPEEPPGIMKPDIVFFGEGLGDEFHKSVAIDKNEVGHFY